MLATLNTKLTFSNGEEIKIKKSKIRGVESFGMLCAEDELGIGHNHEGIMVLDPAAVPGTPAKDYLNLKTDTLFEIGLTPNRVDAASFIGVARDLSAYLRANNMGGELTLPSVEEFEAKLAAAPKEGAVKVTVNAKEAAPRYSGLTIRNVKVTESPDWLKSKLMTIGLRPINSIVDITNYILMEMGQPMHAFDADMIEGNEVVVDFCAEGTKFTTLDEVERTLSSADLMICNAEEPMCIAGVFGGQDSGISETTTNVFLESAYFDPVSIRKTARRHQLSTDASFRYERGCDPNNTLYVLKRCALLIQEVAGGEIAMEITDQGTTHFAPFPVELNISRVNALIGKELGEELIETILHAMEVEIYSKENGIWQIGVPRYRVDVQRECDVVEDILRIYGYNNVEFPEKLNTSLSYNPKPNPVALQIRISEQLTAQGFNEILNNSLTKVSYYESLEGLNLATCVKIMNPLSQDLGVMRQTLLFGGLESIQRNANRKNADLKFYEFGNCYHYNAQKIADRQAKDPHWVYDPLYAYSEEPHLALWLTGNKTTQSWVQKEEKTSFYTLHAYVNNVLRRLGVNIANCTLEPLENELCSDGMVIKAPNGKQIGMMGVVSGKLLKAFDIDNPVYYADLDWNMLLRLNKQYKPVINDLPKFPEAKRDFALLVDKAVKFADLAKAALATEKKLLKQVTLFDVYEGKNLEAGKKSYALSFILQDTENTLKDKQIEAIMAKLLKTFEEKFGAKLR